SVSSCPLFVFSTDNLSDASLPPSPVGVSAPVSLPRSSAPPVLSGAPQNVPLQIGRLTSPPANSIHTVSPTCGRKSIPRSLPPPPGTHGSAQPESTSSPSTAGTFARSRPIFFGSATSVTTPSYLP